MNTARTCFEGRWCLLTTPGTFWILSVHQHNFQRCCYGKWPQGGSISSCPVFFFFLCNFILIFYWNRIAFQCCVQERNSVMHNPYLFFSGSFSHIQKILKSTEKLESEKRKKMQQEVVEKWKWNCSVMSDSPDPMGCSLPGSFIHGILQARVLEWVAISFSLGSSQPWDQTWVSHIVGRRFYHLSHHGSHMC